mmetsp:Transcript_24214/g.46490  ORF Transcript_24214/g.46490 Transcript_24214/m.46490 type:complete len:96 (-) Transcript_24214:972-1259(-)
MHGEAKGDAATCCRESEPLSDALSRKTAKESTIVAFTSGQIHSRCAIDKRSSERTQDMLVIAFEGAGNSDATRPIEGQIVPPPCRNIAIPSPVML